MKLIKRAKTHCSFLIAKRERDLLFSILQQYPVVNRAHFRKRHPVQAEEAKENYDLLEEALVEQQKESRKQLELMLKQPDRFTENDLGYTFRLSHAEIEWLLQVLNDIRVGTWILLGEPKSMQVIEPLTEPAIVLAWTIEIAGRFQHALLQATETAN